MNYTLIGTGNMAHFLVNKFQENGYTCKGIFGRNKQVANSLATIIQTTIFDKLSDIPDVYDACIIAVADNAIQGISQNLNLKKTVVIHTAGSVSLNVITQANRAVLWTIFSIIKNDLPEQENIPVVCDSNNENSRQVVLKLANAISTNIEEAAFEKRQYMHLIAAIGNNFTNHLLSICEQLCKEKNISFDLFRPIIQQTFNRLATVTPYNAQTGAAKRGDEATIQKHLSLLQSHPLWQQVYEKFSASIKDMYNPTGK